MKINILKILSGNKLLSLSAVLISTVVVAGGIYYGVGKFKDKSPEADFIKTGNISTDCTLVYEEPGSPALSVGLIFREYSQGDIDENLYCGQRVEVEGQILEEEDNLPTKINVLKLTMLDIVDEEEICCIPRLEILPYSDADYEGFVTYRNDRYKYEIKWRQEWKQQGENEPPYPPPPAGMSFTRKYSTNPPEYCDYSILSFDGADWFKGELESLRNDDKYQRGAQMIDGQKAEAYILNNDYQHVETYYFSYNNIAYRMGYNYKKTDRTESECLPVFEKMVSSFKFLD